MPKYDEFHLDLQSTKVGHANNADRTSTLVCVATPLLPRTIICQPKSKGCRSAQPY